MDSGEYEELKRLLERLTHSGSPMPGEADVKKRKTLCRLASSEGRARLPESSCAFVHAVAK